MKAIEDLNSTLPLEFKEHIFPIKWKNSNTDGNVLCVGKIKVAGYWFNGIRPKGSIFQYRTSSSITEIKMSKELVTEEECAYECWQVLRKFLNLLKTES